MVLLNDFRKLIYMCKLSNLWVDDKVFVGVLFCVELGDVVKFFVIFYVLY